MFIDGGVAEVTALRGRGHGCITDRGGGRVVNAAMLFGVLYAAVPVVFLLLIVLSRRARRHGGTLRAGVVGAMYDWQNRDKQKALEIIVEGKAAERDPEYPEGDLPQLESPPKKPTA
jgi:hypothetical protein